MLTTEIIPLCLRIMEAGNFYSHALVAVDVAVDRVGKFYSNTILVIAADVVRAMQVVDMLLMSLMLSRLL